MILIGNEFIQEHKPLIYQLLGDSGRHYSREEMQGLFIETVIKLLINARFYRGQYSIGTFIGLQVRSVIADTVSHEVSSEDALPHSVTDEIPEESDEEDDTPLELLQEKLIPFLYILGDTEREVFTDRVLMGLSITHIAEKRELHTKSVSRILRRATSSLTAALKKGRRISPSQRVSTDIPLRHAVMTLLPLPVYFVFKLSYFDGLSPWQINSLNGMCLSSIKRLIKTSKAQVESEWGIRL